MHIGCVSRIHGDIRLPKVFFLTGTLVLVKGTQCHPYALVYTKSETT